MYQFLYTENSAKVTVVTPKGKTRVICIWEAFDIALNLLHANIQFSVNGELQLTES